jgi:hypothetical protein
MAEIAPNIDEPQPSVLAARVTFADLNDWPDDLPELFRRCLGRKQLAALKHRCQDTAVINNVSDRRPAAQTKHRPMHASQKGYDTWFRKLARSVSAQTMAQPLPRCIARFAV